MAVPDLHAQGNPNSAALQSSVICADNVSLLVMQDSPSHVSFKVSGLCGDKGVILPVEVTENKPVVLQLTEIPSREPKIS